MAARGDRRESILEAAIQVFAGNGFHQSRVADVAREAGVADGTIYLYFNHKEDILIAIFEEKMAEVISNLRVALASVSDPRDKLKCFINFHFRQLSHNRPVAEILLVELRLSNKFMKEYVPIRLGEYLDIVAEIFSEGQSQGVFRRELDPAILKRALFGALDELAIHWVMTRGRSPNLHDSAQQLTDVFMRGLCYSETLEPLRQGDGGSDVSVPPEGGQV